MVGLTAVMPNHCRPSTRKDMPAVPDPSTPPADLLVAPSLWLAVGDIVCPVIFLFQLGTFHAGDGEAWESAGW